MGLLIQREGLHRKRRFSTLAADEWSLSMTEPAKPRAVGLNHIALEVGDIEEALAFMRAFSGSNFVARVTLWPSSTWATNSSLCRKGANNLHDGRHFGLVVDDKEAARRALKKCRRRDRKWRLS
jgi:hypothetical protein